MTYRKEHVPELGLIRFKTTCVKFTFNVYVIYCFFIYNILLSLQETKINIFKRRFCAICQKFKKKSGQKPET
jgi:hypothetical protein